MRTVVITGGSDGIGRGLALQLLRRGDRVVAVGTDRAKGRSLSAEAERLGASDRLSFVEAELSQRRGVDSLLDQLRMRFSRIDVLVLGAYRYQASRQETPEGLERTFALYVVARYLLAEGLRPLLEQAPHPVVLNVCGSGGIKAGEIRWDDLQFRERYRGFAATMQGARANDLLGAGFAAAHPATPVRYVLYNPLFVATGLADPFPGPLRAVVKAAAKLVGTPVRRAVEPITELLDAPPEEPLSAFRVRRRVPATGPSFDPVEADRLAAALRSLTAGRAG